MAVPSVVDQGNVVVRSADRLNETGTNAVFVEVFPSTTLMGETETTGCTMPSVIRHVERRARITARTSRTESSHGFESDDPNPT